MRNLRIVCYILLLAFAVSACDGEIITPTDSVEALYTLAAQTLIAENTFANPTEIPQISLPTLLPTATIIPTSTPTTESAANTYTYSYSSDQYSCDDAVYVADVTIPDYTVLSPGVEFVKTWTVQNTGTCSWTESYYLDFVSGYSMSGISTALDQVVDSGESADLSVTLIAPDTEGEYTGYWRLLNADGVYFGDSIFVLIVVSEDVTETPTATSEYTSTPTNTTVDVATSTNTSTNAPTNTSAPTNTPTATSAPANTATNTPESTADDSSQP